MNFSVFYHPLDHDSLLDCSQLPSVRTTSFISACAVVEISAIRIAESAQTMLGTLQATLAGGLSSCGETETAGDIREEGGNLGRHEGVRAMQAVPP